MPGAAPEHQARNELCSQGANEGAGTTKSDRCCISWPGGEDRMPGESPAFLGDI